MRRQPNPTPLQGEAALPNVPLAVPRNNETVLCIPQAAELTSVVDKNVQHWQEIAVDLQGTSLRALREQARMAVVQIAVAYTSSLADANIDSTMTGPLIVTGHQPELFHAGVWAKNFAAGGLAGRTRGQALNLIIDNDNVTNRRIRVPVGTKEVPTIETIAFDASQPQQPWEDATIFDDECFREFGRRVDSRIQECWNYRPLIGKSWSVATRYSSRSNRLCDCLTAARMEVERSHGLRNLEVPMSQVCSSLPFCHFAVFLLAHLPKFQSHYNEAVREYRKLHHLRSSTHPVPELGADDGWLEAPFWVWRNGSRRRERPFAKHTGSIVELRDSEGILIRLPLTPDGPLEAAAHSLAESIHGGTRFRTRALTTTMFARLFLADVFIHGIGGAKYDSMTDQICERFFGTVTPPFATITATAHLPLAVPFPATVADLQNNQHQIRDLRYNPDRYFRSVSSTDLDQLFYEKRQIISTLGARQPTRLEHLRIARINEELFNQLGTFNQNLHQEHERIRHALQKNSILQDREFSWCLHPEELVTNFFRREFMA